MLRAISDSIVAARLVATCAARSQAALRASSSTLPQIAQKHSATTKMVAISRLTGRLGAAVAAGFTSGIVRRPLSPGPTSPMVRRADVNFGGTRAVLVNDDLRRPAKRKLTSGPGPLP